MSLLNAVESLVFASASSEDLFNPYLDRSESLDRADAPAVRRTNLRSYLADHADGAALLLVAEAPGPWGCRFSGVPITSESQLLDPQFPASGGRSGLREEPYSEYSAGIFWRVMQPFYTSFFVWNSVPLHPHRKGEPLSIRTPRTSEIERFLPLLGAVVAEMAPDRILAIGRKAEEALKRIGCEPSYVRHPSQGGARLFEDGVLGAVHDLGIGPD